MMTETSEYVYIEKPNYADVDKVLFNTQIELMVLEKLALSRTLQKTQSKPQNVKKSLSSLYEPIKT
jgi:hypothetical protein